MSNPQKYKIIAVEDNPAYQEHYDDLLSGKYDLTIAGSKEEALNILATETFALAIVDMRLEEKSDYPDGLDVADYIRARTPDTPIILKSGFPTQTPEIEFRIQVLKLIVLDKSDDNQAKQLLDAISQALSG